jgi:hypothetical protein
MTSNRRRPKRNAQNKPTIEVPLHNNEIIFADEYIGGVVNTLYMMSRKVEKLQMPEI